MIPVFPHAEQWQYTLDSHSQTSRKLSGYLLNHDSSDTVIHLLHGNGFCGASYAPLIDSLAAKHSVMTTDLLGHGLSQSSEFRWPNWNYLAADVTEAISAQPAFKNAKRRIAIGHSLGGVLTLLEASKDKDLFDHIIMLDPVLFTPVVIGFQAGMRFTGLWKKSGFINAVSNRQQRWQDKKAAQTVLSSKALYREWHPRALQGFIRDGIKAERVGVKLACDPSWEAKIFSGYPKDLWRSVKTLKTSCHFLYADKSYPFVTQAAHKAQALNPLIEPVPFGLGHCFPMTMPDASGQKILQIIQQLDL